MDFNTIALIYSSTAVVVAIISATIIRAKMSNWDKFDFGYALLSMLFGVVWPLTVVVGFVYLASGFLYDKFCKEKES